MANTFNSPPTLPDPTNVRVGTVLTGDPSPGDAIDLAETLNYAHAEGPSAPVLSQAWGDGQCAWNGAAVTTAEWRVPQPSPDHQVYTIRMRASASAGPAAGQASITSVNTAAVYTAIPAGAAAAWYTGTVNIGQPGAGYDDLQLKLDASAGGDVTVESVTIWPSVKASPLAAGPAGGVALTDFIPYGAASNAADYPASAKMGHKHLRNATALLAYPRMVFCWASLRKIQTYAPASAAAKQLQAIPYRQGAMVIPGTLRAGVSYRVWARCEPDAATDKYVRIYAGSLGPAGFVTRWRNWLAEILVPFDPVQAVVWLTTTIRVTEEVSVRQLPFYTSFFGTFGGVLDTDTTANLLSLSIWEE